MSEFFRKTDAGRRELRERRLGLPRVARNLLLIIDGTRPVVSWVSMIQGATLSDASALLELGLIEPGTGRPAGDSELAGLTSSAPATLTSVPLPLSAAWTRPGSLSDLGGLPSPGAEPRHRAALGAGAATVPADLTAPLPAWADIGTSKGRQPPAAEPRPPDTRPAPHLRAPARPARPAAAGRRAAVAAGAVDTAPPSSLLPDDAAGFIPLDIDGAPAGHTGLGYSELYDSLNALVRETLGLLKGYRYTLKIERARNITELEAVAGAYLAEVQRVRGESVARMARRALGFGG